VLSGSGLGEEGVEGVVAAADRLVRGHLAVRLNAMFKAFCEWKEKENFLEHKISTFNQWKKFSL
jgi:hypothetical protein